MQLEKGKDSYLDHLYFQLMPTSYHVRLQMTTITGTLRMDLHIFTVAMKKLTQDKLPWIATLRVSLL